MSLKESLIKTCHKVYDKGFVAAYDGNLSARIDSDRFMITRSGISKGDVEENDILTIDGEGNLLEGEGKVSTEVKLHLMIYKKRPEINSVVHCHPVYSTAFATVRDKFPDNIFPEVILSFGKVPICRYSTPSTDELPKSIEPYLEYTFAFLLENHGAVTIGKTINGAYFRMEKLEHAAKTLYIAKNLGNIKILPNAKIEELYSIAEETYGIKIDDRNRVNKWTPNYEK